MIKVEKLHVTGWEPAIRGMRNPMNSWDKSDSMWIYEPDPDTGEDYHFKVGKNDLDLMHKLFMGGTEHRKFMRMLVITADITAPLYWWKEFDTYKVGTVANSCSTMHRIHSRDLTLDDFSHEHLTASGTEMLKMTINHINGAMSEYIETKDKTAWWQMIQLLPSSYNQRRTVMLNYEVASTIIRQRSGHKLDEWNTLVEMLIDLPFMYEITTGCCKDYCPINV